MNIFVGNLAADVTDQDLQSEFEAYGKVSSVNIIKDMFTGVSKGFGFVEMPSRLQAETAIKELNIKDIKGKLIQVNEARPQRNKRRGSKGRRR
jgi:RNA recognition motif-containing protein